MVLPVALLPVALGGCIRTAASIVTFPVKAAGQGIDWATTSQDEADRNYGRKVRKQEAREGREAKKQAEQQAKRDREARRRDRD
ncbi:hypothetical protein [Sphingomonas solaris]|uniref:Uncharacterized protein n=1 Tax=Alterirhizorhabdus solaris TaxID=2529389 RepID=A0A558QZ08_9SPHN|nr:hypothetical protein [Sphingomonas solaris]TVV72370.1 hypothetical protein FOY91_14760 [Sphingomonas solaris]